MRSLAAFSSRFGVEESTVEEMGTCPSDAQSLKVYFYRRDSGSASVRLTDFSQVDILGQRYTAVNFGGESCPVSGSPDLIDWGRAGGVPRSKETAPFEDPTEGLCLGPFGGSMGGGGGVLMNEVPL